MCKLKSGMRRAGLEWFFWFWGLFLKIPTIFRRRNLIPHRFYLFFIPSLSRARHTAIYFAFLLRVFGVVYYSSQFLFFSGDFLFRCDLFRIFRCILIIIMSSWMQKIIFISLLLWLGWGNEWDSRIRWFFT